MLQSSRTKLCALKSCRAEFTPFRSTQKVCGPRCAKSLVDQKNARARARMEKAERVATRKALEKLKTLPTLKREAQEAFNLYVRLRDNGKPCFVCGATLVIGGVGGGFDAGHIRSRSEADHLRYDERNVWGQCKECNAAGSTKLHEMRAAAERKLGADVAAELYADNRVIKWSRGEVRETRDRYRLMAKRLKESK